MVWIVAGAATETKEIKVADLQHGFWQVQREAIEVLLSYSFGVLLLFLFIVSLRRFPDEGGCGDRAPPSFSLVHFYSSCTTRVYTIPESTAPSRLKLYHTPHVAPRGIGFLASLCQTRWPPLSHAAVSA
jgi:hypothetical protein